MRKQKERKDEEKGALITLQHRQRLSQDRPAHYVRWEVDQRSAAHYEQRVHVVSTRATFLGPRRKV